MLLEVIKFLDIKPNGLYIDATFGMGGHTKEILKFLNSNGRIFIFDKDIDSINIAYYLYNKDKRVFIYNGSFENIEKILFNYCISSKVDGILVDLGISYLQLNSKDRGFSFNKNSSLDMRMNINQNYTAYNFINESSLEKIKSVLYNFYDEKFINIFIKKISIIREQRQILDNNDLLNIIYNINYKGTYINNPGTKIFQAIRMYVNNEFILLNDFLYNAFNVLKVGGRIVIISFNSIEDKIIKDFVKKYNRSILYNSSIFSIKLVAKYIRPNIDEINSNISSRSAIMRVLEKTL